MTGNLKPTGNPENVTCMQPSRTKFDHHGYKINTIFTDVLFSDIFCICRSQWDGHLQFRDASELPQAP